jgi:hypothetical protein
MANGVWEATRLRDWVLVGCSVILQVLAVSYGAIWLAWVGAGLFWLAVLDSTRHQPRASRVVAAVASAFLVALAVMIVIVVFLTFRPPVVPVAVPVLPAIH